MGRKALTIKAISVIGCLGLLLLNSGCESGRQGGMEETAESKTESVVSESSISRSAKMTADKEAELTIYPVIPLTKGTIIDDYERFREDARPNNAGREEGGEPDGSDREAVSVGEIQTEAQADVPVDGDREATEADSGLGETYLGDSYGSCGDEADVPVDASSAAVSEPAWAEEEYVSDEAGYEGSVDEYAGLSEDGYSDGFDNEPEVEEAEHNDSAADMRTEGEAGLTPLGVWTISFYCPCVYCTGSGNGITASGTYAQPWHTAATGGLEFGTMLYVDGLGYFVVEDRGTDYGWLDVFVSDHSEALALGLQSREVYLVN